jgi:hypothetical protein
MAPVVRATGASRLSGTARRLSLDFERTRSMFLRMARSVPNIRRALAALAVATCLNAGQVYGQDADLAPPVAESGEIDGDLAGWEPPPRKPRYAPGVLEDYERKLRLYEQQVAAEAAAKKQRDERFRRESAAYERKMAKYRKAKRKYEAERRAYEAAMARPR